MCLNTVSRMACSLFVFAALEPMVHSGRVDSRANVRSLQIRNAALAEQEGKKIQEAIVFFVEASARKQSITVAETQREALYVFQQLVGPWAYNQISGTVPLTCGSYTYTGPVRGVAAGLHGIIVMMHRGDSSGPKVVAKFWRGGTSGENLNHECRIMRHIEASGVTGTLTCEAACEHNGHTMIVLSPFLDGEAKSFPLDLPLDYFASEAALRKAVKETFRIGFSMLNAEITNIDQNHNILYLRDGTTTFIDMGLAAYLREQQWHGMKIFHVDEFLSQLFDKMPASWWHNGKAATILREVEWPSTPQHFKIDPDSGVEVPDYKERIQGRALAKGVILLDSEPLAPKPIAATTTMGLVALDARLHASV